MRTSRLASAVSLLFLSAVSLLPAATNDVKKWDFLNAADYSVPEPQFVEIDTTPPGYAQLILQAQKKYHDKMNEYLSGGITEDLVIGPQVSYLLTQTAGLYNAPGLFRSRTIDGGAGVVWSLLHMRASNLYFDKNAMATLLPTTPGLVAYWRFDNAWTDATTNHYDFVPVQGTYGPGFDADAKKGSHSANINLPSFPVSSGYATINSNLGLTDKLSILFWVNSRSVDRNANAPMPISFGPGLEFQLRLGGNFSQASGPSMVPFSIGIYRQVFPSQTSQTYSNTFTVANDQGVWRHIAVTYDRNGSPKTRIFKDGVALPLQNDDVVMTFASVSKVILGARPDIYWATMFNGLIDDVMVFNYVLSPAEVQALYKGFPHVRIRARSSPDGDFSGKQYVGPTGDTNTFYTGLREPLVSAGDFSVFDRYVQYEAEVMSSAYRLDTPLVDSVAFFGSLGGLADSAFHQIRLGQLANLTNYPSQITAPLIGMATLPHGGYPTNAFYESPPIDVGKRVNWNSLSWSSGDGMSGTLAGLIGLYRVDGSWADTANGGGDNSPTSVIGAQYTTFPKLGTRSAVFDNGATLQQVSGFLNISNIQGMAFWIMADNPDDGILEISATNRVRLQNLTITPEDFGANMPVVYVNTSDMSRRLLPGWNHVILVWPSPVYAGALKIGVAGGDYFGGALDEICLFDKQPYFADLKAHYWNAIPRTAGRASFQVRTGETTNELFAQSWGPSYATPADAIFSKTAYLIQYRATFTGDGRSPAVCTAPTISGRDGATPFSITRNNLADAAQGDFDGGKSRWFGDPIMLQDLSQTEPANLYAGDWTALEGLWHFDEPLWDTGTTIQDSSGNGLNGSPHGGASSVADARAGTRGGQFDGVDGYVSLGQVFAPSRTSFTASAWAKCGSSLRAPIVSTYAAGSAYFSLEMNGDGSGATVPGVAAFAFSDGTTAKTAVSFMSNLNDRCWHHYAGVRDGQYIYLYVDGGMVGAAFLGEGYGVGVKGSPNVGKLGALPVYMTGNIDEVAIWERALSEAELGAAFSGKYDASVTGTYVSTNFSAGFRSIWQKLLWYEDGRYGDPLNGDDPDVLAVWHLDGASNPAVDATGGHDGTVSGGTFGTTGRFGRAVTLNPGGQIAIANSGDLAPPELTVEAWVNLRRTANTVVFDKSNGSNAGYRLGTDASGRPFFRIENQEAVGGLPIRAGKWTHLAGTYDGAVIRVFADGIVAGIKEYVGGTPASANAASIGAGAFDGAVDEAAVHGRALLDAAIMDHYRSGVVSLKF
ncbi:MAG: LamG domain-containing protein, partial [Lentisphaerae bacterium]|nr:LamG domain-containing protein [Lentisphaerota bacterium]